MVNKTEDGYRYGYIDYKSKKILDVKYNNITRVFNNKENNDIYLITSLDGKYGFFKNKKNILKNEYTEIIYDDNSGLLILNKNKKYGVALLNGKIIIGIENNEISTKGIYIYAKKENQNIVYDFSGNKVDINFNKTIYTTQNDEYKISTVLNNNVTYYGIINKQNVTLVPEGYRYLEYIFKDLFIAKDDEGNLGIINSNGKIILDFKYSSLQKIRDKNMLLAINNQGETEIYSEDIEKKITMIKASIQIKEDYIIVSNEEEKVYLDNNANLIEDVSTLKGEILPSEIGEYKREQITIENVYYVKK